MGDRLKAFSLLELLIAIVVLSAGISAILQAMSYSAKVTGLSSDMVYGLLLAEDKMQELEFKEKTKQLVEMTDNGKDGKFEWNYSLVLDPDLKLYNLDFKALWQRMGRNEEINLKSYLKQLL